MYHILAIRLEYFEALYQTNIHNEIHIQVHYIQPGL